MVEDASSQLNGDFEAVLLYLKESRGFDFTGYKRTSLARRVRRRMSQVGIDGYSEYIDHLQVNSEEFSALFNTILINVTSFFRDPEAWEHLRTDLVPALLAERSPDDQVRIWSAGCASGEEAYTLAMVFAEAIGPDRFRQRVKIYATDVDEDALDQARQATYPESRASRTCRRKWSHTYFERHGDQYIFRKDLRRSVIFGRNDLVQDAPISRIDLLVCRNTLMYFNAETQTKILGRLHFALAPRGVLFLGKAEMLLSHTRIFDPVDLKRRVFRKTIGRPGRGRELRRAGVQPRPDRRDRQPRPAAGVRVLRGPVAQVVITGDDIVALVNQQAELVFGLSNRDVGRPLRDLEMSYRPVELRAYVEQAKVERRGIRIKDVEWQRGPGEVDLAGDPRRTRWWTRTTGCSACRSSFHDVTAARALLDELAHANRQLESAYEELQSTNEELETTNEELQSTVEELETTNEELQSTNEELETMNEELQSTNDELQAINDTLRERSVELDEVNDFLESILTSIRSGVVVVDIEMRVLAWNRGAEDLWGLRQRRGDRATPAEPGHRAAGVGAAADRARPRCRTCEFEETSCCRRSTGGAGRSRCGCTAAPLADPAATIQGGILLMEPEDAEPDTIQ